MHTLLHRQTWSTLLLSIGALAFMMTAGCETAPSETPQTKRIAELKTEYDQLPGETQAEVAKGVIARNQSPELVYIALGRPDRIVISADGRVTTWTYLNYFPPETKEQKKELAKEIQRRSNTGHSPLQDTFEYWRLGTNPRASLFDQAVAPRAMGQSAADYAAYLRNREIGGYVNPSADSIQREQYKDSLYLSPAPDPVAMKLKVIFVEHLVSDAIVNDAASAFAPRP